MVIKKIVAVCPECDETIVCAVDDVEFNKVDSDVLVTLECPACGALLEDEPMESD